MIYKAIDIKYDTDEVDVTLPESIDVNVPDGLDDYDIVEFISDEISNVTGFCHKGFNTIPELNEN